MHIGAVGAVHVAGLGDHRAVELHPRDSVKPLENQLGGVESAIAPVERGAVLPVAGPDPRLQVFVVVEVWVGDQPRRQQVGVDAARHARGDGPAGDLRWGGAIDDLHRPAIMDASSGLRCSDGLSGGTAHLVAPWVNPL